MDHLKQYLVISPEVQKALQYGRPVVALESTTLAHALPYPQNWQTALRVNTIIEQESSTPAMLAILGGKLRVGLTSQEMEHLAKKGNSVHKASLKDLAVLIAQQEDGATTIAAAMVLASLAGIKVFSTSGIGGVHLRAEKTMDISADLEALGRTNTLVVCSGPKSVLDVGLTLEFLETKGVSIIGYKTSDLPGFFTQKSGYSADYRMDTAAEIAKAFSIKEAIGLRNGIVVANPLLPQFTLEESVIAHATKEALQQADLLEIRGSRLTPFLLEKIGELTYGASLEATAQLLFSNAELAAKIALQLSNI